MEEGPVVRFYESDAALLDLVTRFLGAALGSDRRVLVVASEAHRTELRRRLDDRGFDTPAACQAGRLVFQDAKSTLAEFMIAGMPDWRRFEERVVGRHLSRLRDAQDAAPDWAYLELSDLLWRDGNRQAAIRVEEMCNDAAVTMSLRLAYPIGGLFRETQASPDATWQLRDAPLPREEESGDEVARLKRRVRSLEAEVESRFQVGEALRTALAEARRADGRKDEFMAMLGHELRNPLGAISMALQLMAIRADGATAREREVLERQVSHMVKLIDDLLDVSRISRAKLELQRTPMELADIVGRSLEMTSPLFGAKNLGLNVQIPPRGLAVEADATRLAQVFANLLANAARYTDAGGHVQVLARRDGETVEIAIRDSGQGIAPDTLPHVFELFVRSDQARRRSGEGLGLGLAIVRMLVQLHDGLVTAHSDGIGHGSTFVVRLPAAAAVPASTAPAPAPLRRLE
jgi:signal transduction histidine kinase